VTAVKVPSGWSWTELDATLRAKGVLFGGSYGKLNGSVFRIGIEGETQIRPS
jgi:aspartate aminotransferase-like enzyme